MPSKNTTTPKQPSTEPAIGVLVGSMIRELRISRGLTQAQLADAADIAQSSLYQMEHGLVVPSIVRLQKIAKALQVSAGSLLTETPPTPTPANKRKMPTALESELLNAFAGIPDLAGKRLVIQVARRLRAP